MQLHDGMANIVVPDQTAPQEQSDLGLHCFAQTFLLKYLPKSTFVISGRTVAFTVTKDPGPLA